MSTFFSYNTRNCGNKYQETLQNTDIAAFFLLNLQWEIKEKLLLTENCKEPQTTLGLECQKVILSS